MGLQGANTGSQTSQWQRILHNYCDHSQEIPFEDDDCRVAGNTASATRFPSTLHLMLQNIEEEGLASIVSWEIHGRAFKIHKPREFEKKIIPRYFNQTKITSFHRQLNLYGFLRISQGRDKGAYYELFLRGKHFLSSKMFRQKVKRCRVKRLPSPEADPDFYSMPYITADLNSSTLTDYKKLSQSNIILLHDKKESAKSKSCSKIQQVDCDKKCFLDEGDFDTKILEYFLEEEPDSIFLEFNDVVQYYSMDECNLIFRLCQHMGNRLI
jgi:hypothetical protein